MFHIQTGVGIFPCHNLNCKYENTACKDHFLLQWKMYWHLQTTSDEWVEGPQPHWYAAIGGNMHFTFQQSAYVGATCSTCNWLKWKRWLCWGAYKRACSTHYSSYCMCFSHRHIMTRLACISLCLVVFMMSKASAQGKSIMKTFRLCVCILFIDVIFHSWYVLDCGRKRWLIIWHSCVFNQGGISSCCPKISTTQVHRDLLKSYYEQHRPSCPIHAVV